MKQTIYKGFRKQVVTCIVFLLKKEEKGFIYKNKCFKVVVGYKSCFFNTDCLSSRDPPLKTAMIIFILSFILRGKTVSKMVNGVF